MWQHTKTQDVTKLRMWQNSKCEEKKLKSQKCVKTQKLIMWQNTKTQNVIQLKNSKCDKAQKLKMWLNSKFDRTQNVTKLKNSKCNKTQNLSKLKIPNIKKGKEKLQN